MIGQSNTTCPRCGFGHLRGWNELDAEQREAAQRLPASAEYLPDERRTMHRWCVQCWHEETEPSPSDA